MRAGARRGEQGLEAACTLPRCKRRKRRKARYLEWEKPWRVALPELAQGRLQESMGGLCLKTNKAARDDDSSTATYSQGQGTVSTQSVKGV